MADLAITKTASLTTAAPGAAVSYTLSVTNASGSNAQDVVITDAVANQSQLRLTAVTGTTGGATCPTPQPGSLRCTVASLAAGATATVTVTGVLTSSLAPGTIVANTATVTASTADSDSANNSATATVTVGAGSADLRMTKSVAPTTVVAGSPVTYTLTATNFGPSDALETTITDDLPEGITATSVQTSRGTCTIQADTPSAGRQRVRCTVTGLASAGTGTAAPGAEVQVTIDGTVDSAAAGSLANTAEVASVTSDPDLGNNAATATMEVTRSFDLGVTKRANRSSLPAAAPDDTRPITYTITITNNGPSVATGVVVNDLIPTNDEDPETALEFLAATPGSGSCAAPADIPGDPEHRLLTCTLTDPIPVGDSQTVVVEMLAASDLADLGDDLTETVTIEAPGETNPANNTTTWTLRGDPQSDLELLKTAPATVTAGSMVTYHFEVTNHPPNPEDEELIALAPTLEDTLPDGVTLVPAGDAESVTPAYCDASGQDVTCAMPDNIPPNTTATVEFSVLIDPGSRAARRW